MKKLFSSFKRNGVIKTFDYIFLSVYINLYIIPKKFKNKTGLEIGGPSRFFSKGGICHIYPIVAKLDGVNFSETNIWTDKIDLTEGYIVDGKKLGNQFISDATKLSGLPENYYDFILSCNNIEHIANPLKAIERWLALLKSDGIILIVAPKKEANFDHNRKVVEFSHLISDYNNNILEDDLTHLEEILLLHDLKLDPLAGNFEQFKQRSLDNFRNRCLHHHVFDMTVLSEICNYFNLNIYFKHAFRNDYLIMATKKKTY
ncbi:MAG: class I SAM-dependent methyltransferase [Elusimicrobia bacterium]|nr:class I SAM-dependent methyltransferase [Elusimicrobiota bacterium]